MGSIVVQEFISLDGVVQGGGGPDEDRDGGFDRGGWVLRHDAAHGADDDPVVEEWERATAALLLGRRTYEIWAGHWPFQPEDGPQGELARRYNRVPKHVASRTLTSLAWGDARLLGPDLPAGVRRVREETDGEVRVWGSSVLVRTLMEHDLVDELRLLVLPVVVGAGKRLFDDGPLRSFALLESRALPSGTVVSRYRPSS